MSTSGSSASASYDACRWGMSNSAPNSSARSAVRDATATVCASSVSASPTANRRAMPPVAAIPHRMRSATIVGSAHAEQELVDQLIEPLQPQTGLRQRDGVGPIGAERAEAAFGSRRHRDLVDLRLGQRGLDLGILV